MARAANAGRHGNRRRSRNRRASAVLVILLVLILIPVVQAAEAGCPAGSPSALSAGSANPAGSQVALTPRIISLPPTAVPARQNRSTVVQTVKGIAAERPKVTVPSGIFLVIVAIAGFGLLVILYFSFRRLAGPPADSRKPGKPAPGNPTVIGDTTPPLPESAGRQEGPAVPFPPSLEKRFLHPEFIGEGGLARVFRARNAKTGMTVAVKVPVRFDEVTGTHFTRDIVFWQGLEHPNIVRIWSANILPVPYIEMEYVPSSLAAIPLPLPEEQAVGILLGIARGLKYAHERGIVHRDIKPENILLTADGVPKITDWGLGKSIGDLRQSSVIGFSPAYAAPEQIAPHRYGRPGPSTDIYQSGMLLCELVTGTTAFRGEGMHDLNTAILEDPPAIPLWIGRHRSELERIILRCLAKKPEDRYASVTELIIGLENVQASYR